MDKLPSIQVNTNLIKGVIYLKRKNLILVYDEQQIC